MSLAETIRSLRHRNFRLYFFGQWVSMTGTWMQTTAQMWLVYRLTHSSRLLGLVGFAGQAPAVVFGLLGGVAADRWNRRRLILVTQTLAMIQAALIAVLTSLGLIQVWHIFAMAVFLGLINVFDMPARQAFVVDMVDDRADLGNAIAMNSFLVNASRMVGPAVAGVLVGLYGEACCFYLNALSFLAVLASLAMMRLRPRREPGMDTLAEAARQIRDGLRYAWRQREIRALLVLLGVISLAGVPFITLMPVFADQILHGGPRTVGWLMSAMGVGALGGAIFLARLRVASGLMRIGGFAAAGFGGGLVLFGSSASLVPSLLFMTLTGFFMMTAFTGCNTLLQTLTTDQMRGRVMGLFSMTFMAMAPFGNIAAGYAAERVGAPATVAAGGLVCLFCGVEFLRRTAQSRGAELPDTLIAQAASN